MSTTAERRAGHYREEAERRMAPGHPHTPRSDACTLCMDEACAAHDAKVAEYKVALAAWTPRRPYKRWELALGVIQFPFILVGGVALFFGFYGHLFIGFRTVRVIDDIGLEDALTWLIGAGLIVVIGSLALTGSNEVPRPQFPRADPFTYNALSDRFMRNRPMRQAPWDPRSFREQWPDDRPLGTGPTPMP